jgi:3-methyladenine DNA glycosylase AlkC
MSVTPETLLREARGKGLFAIRHVAFEASRELTPEQSLELAEVLFTIPDPHGAVLSTFLAGHVSPILPAALRFLRQTPATHPNMVVQEALARSLDHYCLNRGYERAYAVLTEWARDSNENVRRASVEAPRPWMKKKYFEANPKKVLDFLTNFRGEPSLLVRYSLGNAVAEMCNHMPALAASPIVHEFGVFGAHAKALKQVGLRESK